MKRRAWLQAGLAAALGTPLMAALKQSRLDEAAAVLDKATVAGRVSAAVLHVVQDDALFTRHFGQAATNDARFLLGSITKPICITPLMTLFDRGEFRLDDPLSKFFPQFKGAGRERVTIRHLLSHVSGLPDQLAGNDALRRKHAGLAEFVEHAQRAPLSFAPGEKYQYSSMGILLAAHLSERLTRTNILELVDKTVLQPLGMKHSVLGLGKLTLGEVVPSQTEFAAPEAGAGDPSAKAWDWNSPYWRRLGAPWGGAHASAPDLARFLAEFVNTDGAVVKRETARLMVSNQNPEGLTPRGLGFNVGNAAGSTGCSGSTFGHTGSTGTIAWHDPSTHTTCVVLTSLPGRAVQPHPRDLAGALVAAAARS